MKVDRRLARKLYRRLMPILYVDEGLYPDFAPWLEYMTSLAEEIELYPGRRAVIPQHDLRWEVRWQLSSEDGLPYVTAFGLEAPPGQAFNPLHLPMELPLAEYWAALALRLNAQEAPPEEAPPPASGKPPSIEHYRKVMAEYDELVRQGERSPIGVLAERYRVKPGTVKAWRHRGQKYLSRKDTET